MNDKEYKNSLSYKLDRLRFNKYIFFITIKTDIETKLARIIKLFIDR